MMMMMIKLMMTIDYGDYNEGNDDDG